MSQGTLSVGNLTFPAFRGTMNGAFDALKTSNSGTSAPGGAAAGMFWYDTSNGTRPVLKVSDGSDWINVENFDTNANRNYKGTMLAGSGGTGAPSIAFENDPDTGWYQKSANSIAESVGGVDARIVSSGGAQTMPLQPSVRAVAADQTNVTGDGTVYTVTWSGSETYDQGGNFSSPTFTWPVNGKLMVMGHMSLSGVGAGHLLSVTFVTSNGNQQLLYCDIAVLDDGSGFVNLPFCGIMTGEAADTASVSITVSGGAKTIDVNTVADVTFALLH